MRGRSATADPLPRLTRKPTLADVAERAGVSPSTASRALNGHAGLAPATRAAVADAAATLNFRPSALARSLRMRRTHTVGFVVPDVSSPFYAAVLRGAQGRLERAGYSVMLMDARQDVEREAASLENLLLHEVDGLLICSTGMRGERFGELLNGRQTPTVFFDGLIGGAGDGSVSLDDEAGIRMLVEHLVAHGHERIGFLAGSQSETAGAARFEAFQRIGAEYGLPLDSRDLKISSWTIEGGRRTAMELLGEPARPTAAIASSAELALGFLAAAAALDVRIPADVALVAFDDPYFGDLLDPPLTAVRYDAAAIGETAASLLVDALADSGKQRHVSLPVELVVRRSCGCGPGDAR